MAEGHVRRLKNLDESIKRLTAQLKDLRKQRVTYQTALYQYMKKSNVEEVEGYKLAKIAPKPKMVRKKDKDKKQDAVCYFTSLGLNDPEGAWERLKEMQKPKVYIEPKNEEEEE